MSQTIPINMPDGSVEQIDANTVVNAENALLESMRKPPAFHKVQMIPCRVDVQREVAQIQGGIGFIKHPARMRMAAAAGCRQYGPPRVWRELIGDEWVTRAQMSFTRPGFYNEPVSIVAQGTEEQFAKNVQKHMTAILQTQATKRCLTQIMGEAFQYDMSYLRERNGLFVFACISEDTEDPDVRQILLERMRGAKGALYAPQALPTPSPDDVMSLPSGVDVEFDMEEGGADDTNTQNESESIASEGTAAPPDLPAWAKSFARDRLTGAVNFESLPADKVEAIVRKAIKSEGYPLEDDAAGVVKACKASDWVGAARRLHDWQAGGGADA